MSTHSTHFFQTFGKDFLKCGLTGWCMEICFTALASLRRRDMQLKGTTSLWMFPIYGCAAVFRPLAALLKKMPAWLRGLTYMSMIFSTEYASGRLLSKHALCPWNYRRSRWNIHQVVRLDYAPFWFLAGLFFESLLQKNSSS